MRSMASAALRTITVTLGGPSSSDELAALRDRIVALVVREGAEVALCDVSGLRADAVGVEALGLLQLAARRGGWQLRLLNPSRELLELIAFMGLSGSLPVVQEITAAPAARRAGTGARRRGRR